MVHFPPMGKSIYPPGAIFCRTCGYCLHGLPSNICPECGHAFDPADPATFLARPRRVWVKRTIFWTILGVLVLAIAYGGFLTWLYVGWRAEAGARAVATGEYDKVETRSILPAALSYLLVGNCRQWQERVDTLNVFERRLSSDQAHAIASCRSLRVLGLYGVRLNAEDVGALCTCKGLEELNLYNAGLRAGDLAPVSELVHLTTLRVYGSPELGDRDLAAVAKLKRLGALGFGGTAIKDGGLTPLAGLANLELLSLGDCRNLTDAAVPHLRRLTGLKELWFDGTQLTPEGIRNLRTALPQCRMNAARLIASPPVPATGPAD